MLQKTWDFQQGLIIIKLDNYLMMRDVSIVSKN